MTPESMSEWHKKWLEHSATLLGIPWDKCKNVFEDAHKEMDETRMIKAANFSAWRKSRRGNERLNQSLQETLTHRQDICMDGVTALLYPTAWHVSDLAYDKKATPFRLCSAMRMDDFVATAVVGYYLFGLDHRFYTVVSRSWSLLNDRHPRDAIPVDAWPPGFSKDVTPETNRDDENAPMSWNEKARIMAVLKGQPFNAEKMFPSATPFNPHGAHLTRRRHEAALAEEPSQGDAPESSSPTPTCRTSPTSGGLSHPRPVQGYGHAHDIPQ